MTMPTMTFKPYSVVVVPFPFTDSGKAKTRPALVLSLESFQAKNGHVTLAMITTAKRSDWYGDTNIRDLESAGLPVDSIVRQKLFTIDERLIQKQIGSLSSRDKKAVVKALAVHLNLG